jgi:hypothetical protein
MLSTSAAYAQMSLQWKTPNGTWSFHPDLPSGAALVFLGLSFGSQKGSLRHARASHHYHDGQPLSTSGYNAIDVQWQNLPVRSKLIQCLMRTLIGNSRDAYIVSVVRRIATLDDRSQTFITSGRQLRV